MKRIGFVYNKLLDKEFIKQTIKKASKHKAKRKSVRKVLANIDFYTDKIYEMLETQKIVMGKTRIRYIRERGKQRKIVISPFFPNQILDNLLVELTKPLIKQSMYRYCVGNVDGRGIMYGKNYIARNFRRYKYYMKLDIRHFYENVNIEILMKFFERKIKDKKFLWFMRKVIDKNELPIGCYYSQWFSNFFLCKFDHYVKEKLKCPLYERYVDDMVFASNNKRKLKYIYHKTKRLIYRMFLEYRFVPSIREKLNFLGFVFTQTIIKIRHNIFYRLQRTIRKIKKHLCFSLAQRLISYFSWLKNVKIGYTYYRNNICPIIKLGKLRKIMSLGGI